MMSHTLIESNLIRNNSHVHSNLNELVMKDSKENKHIVLKHKKSMLGPQSAEHKDRKTLILDLDET